MPVNHNINVNLRSSVNGISSLRTSAKNSVSKITSKKDDANFNPKNVARGLRMIRTLDTSTLGLFGGNFGNPYMWMIQETVKLSSKVMDYILEYQQAETGNKMRVGNIKRAKGYVLNPMSYIVDGTWGVHLQRMQIGRENEANAYYRELSGNLIVGDQYKGQR